jgi:hypothetical protein
MTSIRRSTRSRLCERLAFVYRHDVATPFTGTVTTNGTTTVEGSGTSFLTQYATGALIQIDGEQPNTVASVTDNDTLVLTTAATTTGGTKGHTGSQGLFEYFGGIVGAGSIDSPQTHARIQVWPVEALGETLRTAPFVLVQPMRPSGILDAMPSGADNPLYEIMVTMFIRTEPRELVAGVLNTDDVYLHLRNVAMAGDNASVPGKLLDPDTLGTGNSLNVHLAALREEAPQRFRDVTLYPLTLAYLCRENMRTGALL